MAIFIVEIITLQSMLSFNMSQYDRPRDVSHLKGELPLTYPLLQRFENKWHETNQLRDLGKHSCRVNLQTTVFLIASAAVGVPEIGLSLAKYAVRGLVRSCKWE